MLQDCRPAKPPTSTCGQWSWCWTQLWEPAGSAKIVAASTGGDHNFPMSHDASAAPILKPVFLEVLRNFGEFPDSQLANDLSGSSPRGWPKLLMLQALASPPVQWQWPHLMEAYKGEATWRSPWCKNQHSWPNGWVKPLGTIEPPRVLHRKKDKERDSQTSKLNQHCKILEIQNLQADWHLLGASWLMRMDLYLINPHWTQALEAGGRCVVFLLFLLLSTYSQTPILKGKRDQQQKDTNKK